LALFAAFLLAASPFLSAYFFSSYLMFVNAFFVMCFVMPGVKYDGKDVISGGTLMLTSVHTLFLSVISANYQQEPCVTLLSLTLEFLGIC
jgi:hypothetical protein